MRSPVSKFVSPYSAPIALRLHVQKVRFRSYCSPFHLPWVNLPEFRSTAAPIALLLSASLLKFRSYRSPLAQVPAPIALLLQVLLPPMTLLSDLPIFRQEDLMSLLSLSSPTVVCPSSGLLPPEALLSLS